MDGEGEVLDEDLAEESAQTGGYLADLDVEGDDGGAGDDAGEDEDEEGAEVVAENGDGGSGLGELLDVVELKDEHGSEGRESEATFLLPDVVVVHGVEEADDCNDGNHGRWKNEGVPQIRWPSLDPVYSGWLTDGHEEEGLAFDLDAELDEAVVVGGSIGDGHDDGFGEGVMSLPLGMRDSEVEISVRPLRPDVDV